MAGHAGTSRARVRCRGGGGGAAAEAALAAAALAAACLLGLLAGAAASALTDFEAPVQSTQRCIGTPLTSYTRVCYFTDIIYDRETQTFLFYTQDLDGVMRTANITQLIDNNDYIHVGRMRRTKRIEGLVHFRISFLAETFPPMADICDQTGLSYLHEPFNDWSYGHLLRDNFSIMSSNLMALGLERRDFRLVAGKPVLTDGWKKYYRYVATSITTWWNVTDGCGKRYVLFRELVAGLGARRLTAGEVRDEYCAAEHFLAMRNRAYRLARLRLGSVATMRKKRVAFLDRAPNEPRRIDNVAELVPALQAQFPTLEITAQVFHHLSPRDQLAYLRGTAVLVTTGGSASFRLIFLPTGSYVVLVGATERSTYRNVAFHEAAQCWNHMEYTKVLYYHTRDEGEAVVRFVREGHENEHARWWDSDVHVNVHKLAAIIDVAYDAMTVRHYYNVRNFYARAPPPPPPPLLHVSA